MAVDSVCWAMSNNIKLMGNTSFSIRDCQYMADIMRDKARFVAVMKGAQARITTAFMLRAIHCLINGIYPQGVIYYFPGRTDVEDFSKTRMTPLIDDNPCIKKHLKSTDSIFVKKVGKAFLTLKGATATKNIEGKKKDSMAARSMPADELIRDERDLFSQSIVDMMPDRLYNSKFKREVDLGTPTIPSFGIDKVFAESDQKNVMIRCGACNEYTCLADEWPRCVGFNKRSEPFFACIKCGKPIDPLSGEFVPKYRDREISGYHVPHLITPNCELSLVMKRWEATKRDDTKLGPFRNSVLGLPYLATENSLTESDVFACCGDELMRTDTSIRHTAMGVDIGKRYHAVLIGEKIDKKRAKVIYACRVKGFDAVGDLAKQYNVKSAVICLRPYEEEFGKFRDKHSGKMRVFGSEYNPSYKQKTYMKVDEKAGIYTLHKTQAFDRSHNWVKDKEVEFPRKCKEMQEVARQLSNPAKILDEKEDGSRVYMYIPRGDDHYRSALNYLQIALEDLTAWEGMGTVGYKTGGGSSFDVLEYGL